MTWLSRKIAKHHHFSDTWSIMDRKIGTCNQDVRGLKIAMFTHFPNVQTRWHCWKSYMLLFFGCWMSSMARKLRHLYSFSKARSHLQGWKVMGSYFLDARSMSLWPSKFPKTECLLDFGDMSPWVCKIHEKFNVISESARGANWGSGGQKNCPAHLFC